MVYDQKAKSGLQAPQRDCRFPRSRHKKSLTKSGMLFSQSLFGGKSKQKRLPTVIGVGVKKCGTSTLNDFLSVNPYLRGVTTPEMFQLRGTITTEVFYFDANFNKVNIKRTF